MLRSFSEVVTLEIPEGSLLVSVGLPGSWKSPVTEEIARMRGFSVIRSDIVRLEVLKGLDIFENRVASNPENRKRVYDEMFRQAAEALKDPTRGLILDATFITQALRSRAAELAERADRAFVIAECVCTEEKSIGRILRRTKENYESNALTREAYLNNKALFEPVDIKDLKNRFGTVRMIHFIVDTEADSLPAWEVTMIEKN